MTSLEDRRAIRESVAAARGSGARLAAICDVIGVDPTTLRRWSTADGLTAADKRSSAARRAPAARLSEAERQAILEVANRPQYADLPPTRIVPMLADEGAYIASESSFYRVLREAGQLTHRGRSKAPVKQRPPTTHVACRPNMLWAWDMTFLPTQVIGQWLYLYLILDVFSRKIVAWEVHATDDADHAVRVVKRAALAEGIAGQAVKPVLHGDNGATLKATTVLGMLNWLGIKPSYSRPRVSNDNAYAEALFKTAKYRPEYPKRGFATLDEARRWAADFVHWYNHEHRHSGIRYVTPAQRHAGSDRDVLRARQAVYEHAKARCPHRWNGRPIRNWNRDEVVTLNPEKDAVCAAVSNAPSQRNSA
jgi:transposase InsO family protein